MILREYKHINLSSKIIGSWLDYYIFFWKWKHCEDGGGLLVPFLRWHRCPRSGGPEQLQNGKIARIHPSSSSSSLMHWTYENYPPNLCTSLAAHLSEIKMQICHTEKSRSSSPSCNVFANQVESWDDEAAANAEGDDHGLVLQQQIAKERELATKVVKMIRIGVVVQI